MKKIQCIKKAKVYKSHIENMAKIVNLKILQIRLAIMLQNMMNLQIYFRKEPSC